MLDRVFLTLEHGYDLPPPSREIDVGQSVVRLRPRANGYLTCDFNVPKIHQGHNATLLTAQEDQTTIYRVIETVSTIDPKFNLPIERWKLKSLEVAENRVVPSSDHFLYSLALQSVTTKNAGHINHNLDPCSYFGSKTQRSRFYGKEAECGRIEGVDLKDVIRHEISVRGLSVAKHVTGRALPNLFEWLDSSKPTELLAESWRKYALTASVLDPMPIVEYIFGNYPEREAQQLVSFFLTRQAYGSPNTMKFHKLSKGVYYRRKNMVNDILSLLSA